MPTYTPEPNARCMPPTQLVMSMAREALELRHIDYDVFIADAVRNSTSSAGTRTRTLNVITKDCEGDEVPMTIVSVWTPRYIVHTAYMGAAIVRFGSDGTVVFDTEAG